MALSPMTSARLSAGGRLLIGIGLVARPELASRQWLGDVSADPAAQVAIRALGVRDFLLGAITLHTLSSPAVGPRMLQACALADTVDAAATLAARDKLPSPGVWAVIALAGGAALDGLRTAQRLRGAAAS